jgi:hypothetical protein
MVNHTVLLSLSLSLSVSLAVKCVAMNLGWYSCVAPSTPLSFLIIELDNPAS